MRHFGLRLPFLAVAALAISVHGASSPAFPESASAALEKFGLVGTWSDDCARDPAKDGGRLRFTVPLIGAPRMEDPRTDDSAEITSAVRVTEDKIKIQFVLPAKLKAPAPGEEVFKKEGNRLRIWDRKNPLPGYENSGIRNGRWFGSAVGVPRGQTGGEASLLERCLN